MKPSEKQRNTTVVLLGSHLVVAVTALAAGVVLGGWLAFETGYWRGFRAWVHSLADAAALLALGLLVIAVGIGLATTYRHAATN